MGNAEKWILSAIGALIVTTIGTALSGLWHTFLFTWLFYIPIVRVLARIWLGKEEKRCKKEGNEQTMPKPFILSEYHDRIEQASLAILEEQKPLERIVILWWGLDGMKINEDGSLEWISRKKPEPADQDKTYLGPKLPPFIPTIPQTYPFYTTYMGTPLYYSGMDTCQSTRSQINALMAQNTALRRQAVQEAQSAAMITAPMR